MIVVPLLDTPLLSAVYVASVALAFRLGRRDARLETIHHPLRERGSLM